MFQSIGLDTKYISNHSLYATGVSRMFSQGVPEKMIMEMSEHLSSSGIRSYEQTTSTQKQEFSDTLLTTTACSSELKPAEVKTSVLSERQLNMIGREAEIKMEETSTSKENEASNLLKQINFQKTEGCTINLNFSP